MGDQGPSMDLSSFTDIMTCVLGILVLIILLTGIDASQIVVLVSTPKELTGDDKSPVFFECRNKQLFHIDLEELKVACDVKTEQIRALVLDNEAEFLKASATTVMELGGQRLDYTYALLGKYVLTPIPDADGYKFERYMRESPEMWFGSRLAKIDRDTQFICFFVRPDSFKVFQQARALAWVQNINVSCELLDEKDPIQIGPGGNRIYAQ